jgi:hypothetical protein
MIKKIFRDDSMSEAHIKLWYSRFKDGRESVESDRRSGCNQQKSATDSARIKRRSLGNPRTIVSWILTEDLGRKRVAAKFVPRLLSQEQKDFPRKSPDSPRPKKARQIRSNVKVMLTVFLSRRCCSP